MDKFEKYKNLKSQLLGTYRGYPLAEILAVKIAAIPYEKTNYRFVDLIKLFRVRKVELPAFDTKKTIFSIGEYNRQDYYQLLDYVRNNIDSYVIDLAKTRFTYRLNVRTIFFSFQRIWQCYKHSELSLRDKIHLFYDLTYHINTIEHLEKIDINREQISNFCAFCSNLSGEAELNYFFKKHDIPTYTLQHGLWFLYSSPQPIDALVYDNLLADKLLCWGEYTREQFSNAGIDSESICVTGYPRAHFSALKVRNNHSNRILILFARNSYDNNNKKIIDMVSTLKDEYVFEYKLHPSLDKDEYSSILSKIGCIEAEDKTISELLSKVGYLCTITYNSTAYYDSYVNNCTSLRFIDENADNSISVMDDGFRNILELKQLLSSAPNNARRSDYWECVSERLSFILGFNINRYKYFLRGENEQSIE